MTPLYSDPPWANGFRDRPNGLPSFSSALHEKFHRHGKALYWFVPFSIRIPGVRNRRLRLLVPNVARLHQSSVARFGRRRGTLLLFVAFASALFFIFALQKRFGTEDKKWPTPLFTSDPSTLVFGRKDLQNIWRWEVQSGHYPSTRESESAFLFCALIVSALHVPTSACAPQSQE